MNNESMNYVRKLVEIAYRTGAANLIAAARQTGQIPPFPFMSSKMQAEEYANQLQIDEKALRCWNSERAEGEEGSANLRAVPTTPGACAQLTPLAADLEGLAVSLGVLAGNVSSEQWEFLKMFRTNLRAAAERVAALENSLEVPHEQA